MITMPPRRTALNTLVAILVIVLLYSIFVSRQPNSIPIQKQTAGQKPLNSHGFRWSDYKPQYPVTDLTPLPSTAPKQLPRIQHTFNAETSAEKAARVKRQSAVRDVFRKCWSSYRGRAWMMDELAPISGRGRNMFGGWAATLVDSLDTLWIMGLQDEFHEAADASTKIDFGVSTDETVNVFETNIRYLGGFLAAYDLSGRKDLLDSAVNVGEMILAAFDTPNHLPNTRWLWENARDGYKQVTPVFMLLSELGSFTLEFTRLSQLTGDMRWYHAADKITKLLASQQMDSRLPGMWPVRVNPNKEILTEDTMFTLGGMSDSTYEYLPKAYQLLSGTAPEYQTMYEQAMSAAIEKLLFRPMTPTEDDILVFGDLRALDEAGKFISLSPRGQHLGCFTGGMFALGGRLFSHPEHVEIGRKLTEGCIWAYHAMERGVMPEIATFVPCEDRSICPWNQSAWHEHVLSRAGPGGTNLGGSRNAEDSIDKFHLPPGYAHIDDPRYILRPEAIESVFIMYRITGDRKYQDRAWEMFTSIVDASHTEYGNAAIMDIAAPVAQGRAPMQDRMESFWMAETLKYFYLIFSEPDLISLDDFVLNTEAHPFRRAVP